MDVRHYELVLAKAGLEMAEHIAESEDKESRADAMRRVIDVQREKLTEEFADLPEEHWNRPLESEIEAFDRGEATTFLIDLAFDDPFRPYEFFYKPAHRSTALEQVSELCATCSDDIASSIQTTMKSAAKAHRSVNWTKVALFGSAGLLAGAAGGWAIAPLIGSTIGASAGLYGAAATMHGLATIGGGAISAGGFGVAGGMWLVAGGAGAGAAGLGASVNVLRQLTEETAELELVKLQVTYALVVKSGLSSEMDQTSLITSLVETFIELGETIDHEEQLNDPKAPRLKELRSVRDAVDKAIEWIKEYE